jgi:hypothetical protein
MIQCLMVLALEANHVIGLRLMKQMRGGKRARRESQLMINEKIDAAFKAGESTMAGASAAKVVQGYRRRVAANAKRLSRSWASRVSERSQGANCRLAALPSARSRLGYRRPRALAL